MADNSKRIAEIRKILASGVTSTTVDGVATTFDHDSLRRELNRLQREDDSLADRRPAASSIDLSGFRG